MATIHFILQGKGGVGKSFVASMLVQFFKTKTDPELVFCIDTDPVNHTLAGYKEFNATVFEIMRGDEVDPRSFDRLMEKIFELPEGAQMVVDNGASSFIPLGSYLAENNALPLLREQGHQVLLHTVVTGGQAIADTLQGLSSLVTSFDNFPIVVWLNQYFGEISMNGKRFETFKIYKDNEDKIFAVIEIPQKKQSTFGKDIEALLAEKISFNAAIHSPRPVMERQRIKKFWSDAFSAIEQANLTALPN